MMNITITVYRTRWAGPVNRSSQHAGISWTCTPMRQNAVLSSSATRYATFPGESGYDLHTTLYCFSDCPL